MRIGSTKIARAFINGEAARTKNTYTNGTTIFLHGHAIVWKEKGVIHFNLCGWNTVTTRDRINHVFRVAGITLTAGQHKFAPVIYNYNTNKTTEISSRLPYSVADFVE